MKQFLNMINNYNKNLIIIDVKYSQECGPELLVEI